MTWKERCNGEQTFLDTTYSGICKICGKRAEVTSFFSSSMECKTDLQKTYRFRGYKCSLQGEKDFLDPACMDECPLIRKEHR